MEALTIEKSITMNGLELWGIKNQDLPIIDIMINFKNCGYVYDERNNQGIGLVLQEIINNGLFTNNPEHYFNKIYSENIKINAEITEDNFIIKIRTTKNNIKKALNLCKEATLFKMNINSDTLTYLHSIIVNQHRIVQNDLKQTLIHKLKHKLSSNNPYKGYKYFDINHIKTFNGEKILHKHRDIFTRNNLVLSIVGDYEDDILQLIDENFNHLYFQKNNKKINQTVNFNNKTEKNIQDSVKNVLAFAIPHIKFNDSQYFKQLMLINILDINHSKIFNNVIQQELDFFHEIKCIPRELYHTDIILCYIKTSDYQKTKREFINIINNIEDYLSDQIIEINKNNLIERLSNIEKLNNHEKLEIMNMMQIYNLSENYFDNLIRKIQDSKPGEIRSYIKNTLNPKKITFI